MYCERASRALEDPAGIQTEALTLNPELQKHAQNNPYVYRKNIFLIHKKFHMFPHPNTI